MPLVQHGAAGSNLRSAKWPNSYPTMFRIAIIHPRMLELPIDDRVDRSSSHVYRTTGNAVLAIPGV